ncbi:hypothetical protein B0T25DRAFT_544138 [Lasiosphaeria hispida]|uniref:Uncharacterized protein n=1 Tax=Lasiosphaeria hispida TaxID=260671 RepID=A0AAJ0HIX5_9PEZI|nr:hypothetical protein B0T25DRAFT_544138 [Lasiosphaeria hispida]
MWYYWLLGLPSARFYLETKLGVKLSGFPVYETMKLYDSFSLKVSPTTISQTLKTKRWARKTNGHIGKQQNPDLRELYLYKLSDCLISTDLYRRVWL